MAFTVLAVTKHRSFWQKEVAEVMPVAGIVMLVEVEDTILEAAAITLEAVVTLVAIAATSALGLELAVVTVVTIIGVIMVAATMAPITIEAIMAPTSMAIMVMVVMGTAVTIQQLLLYHQHHLYISNKKQSNLSNHKPIIGTIVANQKVTTHM